MVHTTSKESTYNDTDIQNEKAHERWFEDAAQINQ
jgi:hypothetical protein